MLPFAAPSITDSEIDAVVSTLRSGWVTTGPQVKSFEKEMAALLGAPATLAVTSCTAALHLALLSLGVSAGDAVITTPWTFCATVHAIEYVGAIPVFVDVDPRSFNIDATRVGEVAVALAEGRLDRLTTGELRSLGDRRPRPRAILPVHFAGYPADMELIAAGARAVGAAVVEDAAHALGAAVGGRPVGQVHDGEARAVCFSFYATKNLTTGDGGMLAGPPGVIDRARRLSTMGIDRDAWQRQVGNASGYDVTDIGFKYAMTDLHAALGRAQLPRLSASQHRRAAIAARYTAGFRGVSDVRTPEARPGDEPAHHLYVLELTAGEPPVDGRRMVGALATRNIGASVHFRPVHLQPAYRRRYGFRPGDFPVAETSSRRVVSLPLYPAMTDADVDDVVCAVREVLERGVSGR